MEDHRELLRQATITWLRQARTLTQFTQAITDEALATLPAWDDLSNAVTLAAPKPDHRDLYGKFDGDWLPKYHALLGASGLGDATRLIAMGAKVPLEEVADNFVAFCTDPAPPVEEWLLLNAHFPGQSRVDLGRYTLQTFTAGELRRMQPMPAIHGRQPWALDLGMLTHAPFIHLVEPDREPARGALWFDFRGPRAEAQHWRALLPLILWSPELVRVDAVFDVERGRRFDLTASRVPTTIQIHQDHDGTEKETEVHDAGSFTVTPSDLEALQAFCAAVAARIDAVMDGISKDSRLLSRRARRLERAARHLLRSYQRTYQDDGVWEQDVDEFHLDYVIALEALMASPIAKNHDGITSKIRARSSALFLTPERREAVGKTVQKAYDARSRYVHGEVLKDPGEKKKLDDLRGLRLLVRDVILRWLVLTPADHRDLASLLDGAADGSDRERVIDEPLRAFFAATPPKDVGVGSGREF
jgi:hypothetical protein